MSEYYVSKDTYDANMAEIRALIAAGNKETRLMMEGSEARYDAKVSEMRGDIAVITGAISGIKDRLSDIAVKPSFEERLSSRVFMALGIAGSLSAVIIAGVQVYMSLFGGK